MRVSERADLQKSHALRLDGGFSNLVEHEGGAREDVLRLVADSLDAQATAFVDCPARSHPAS